MEHKSFGGRVEIKTPEEGLAEMIVSAFGNVDQGNDVVVKGAFAKQIAKAYGDPAYDFKPRGVWSHDVQLTIGKTEDWWESDEGLHILGRYNLKTQRGREAFEDVRFFGEEQQFSFAYEVLDKREEKGVRYLTEVIITEWSPVMLGMNSLTRLVGAKSLLDRIPSAEEVRRAEQAGKALAGSFEALRERLYAVLQGRHGGTDRYVWVRGTLADRVVYDVETSTGSTTYEAPYDDSGDELTVGDPTEVTVEEVTVPKAAPPPIELPAIARSKVDEFRLLVATTRF